MLKEYQKRPFSKVIKLWIFLKKDLRVDMLDLHVIMRPVPEVTLYLPCKLSPNIPIMVS